MGIHGKKRIMSRMKWKMYLSKNTMYYEILVTIQSHADLYKTGCGGLPTKTVFINLYGEKPYMSKRKAACSDFANVDLNSYQFYKNGRCYYGCII